MTHQDVMVRVQRELDQWVTSDADPEVTREAIYRLSESLLTVCDHCRAEIEDLAAEP